jgi:peptidoglycan hydrolase-like protein with peptidoglycan-binding domain
MPKKTITIFITTFILVGIIILGVYFWINKKSDSPKNNTTPWYQNFNPFGTGSNIPQTEDPVDPNNPNQPEGPVENILSKFYQITDFAIAGATYTEETRPIVLKEGETPIQEPEPVKIIISAETKEGRKEIQTILNETLSLKTPLVVDGVFGKKVTEALKEFQKLNNLNITGTINDETALYFSKTDKIINPLIKNQYEQVPSIRFVERKNGHIYKMFLDTKIKDKISNSTIPSIYEAFFDNTSKSVIYRYLSEDKTISSFMATLGAQKGEFLPPNISDMSVSKDKTMFFYLTENSNGSIGTVGYFGLLKKDLVFNSPFTEWTSSWSENQKLFLTTKPSYTLNGSMFSLNTTTKTISKIFGGIAGLTTLINNSGSSVLYSNSTMTGPKLGIFNINEYSSKDLETYGLPEKCVWSKDNINVYCAVPNVITGNQYPDSWYQGLISFTDYFIKINTSTGNKTTIANSALGTPVDGTYLFLDKEESLLFFTNKKDSTLWSLDLK